MRTLSSIGRRQAPFAAVHRTIVQEQVRRTIHQRQSKWQDLLFEEWRRLFAMFRRQRSPQSPATAKRVRVTPSRSLDAEMRNIRKVMAEIRTRRESERLLEGQREIRYEKEIIDPSIRRKNRSSTTEHGAAKGRRRPAKDVAPVSLSIGGRGLVNKKRLYDMGISPMLLHEKPMQKTAAEVATREVFLNHVCDEVLVELRDLLEESR